jgi:peptide-methionine (S)-S-oxide reductase
MTQKLFILFTILLIPQGMDAQAGITEKATLGGGCFWCLEAVFEQMKGVKNVESGYAGGQTLNPTYEEVCGGQTGHAEVVQITYDPLVVSFEMLLKVFFVIHDPTTLNRQGADIGTQYRSVIFYHNRQQKTEAENYVKKMNQSGKFSSPIVTQVDVLSKFYKAEVYHQDYFARNPNQPYCRAVIAPKVDKFKEVFK